MLLASYTATKEGFAGLGNILIRARLRGQISHNEIVFTPEDGPQVAKLMPDGNLGPVNGALWCASSSAMDHIPEWSGKRAGKLGGVRFKRIVLDASRWEFDYLRGMDAFAAAKWFVHNEGSPYDYALIASYLAWVVPQSRHGKHCSEACANALGISEGWRFDPCSLRAAVAALVPKP